MYCPSCGTQNPVGAQNCEKCRALLPMLSNTRPGEVGAKPSDERTAGGYCVARLGDRLIAVALDSVLGVALFALIGMYAAVRLGGVTESGFSLGGGAALVGM